VIAEADLKLRGPGDLEGTQQSGIPFDLRIADIVRDSAILYRAREIAEEDNHGRSPAGATPSTTCSSSSSTDWGGNRYEWSRIS